MSFSLDLILLSTKICEDVDKLSILNELNLTQLKKYYLEVAYYLHTKTYGIFVGICLMQKDNFLTSK